MDLYELLEIDRNLCNDININLVGIYYQHKKWVHHFIYLLTVCRLDFRLWVLATRVHSRGVRLPLLTLTSLGSGAAGGLLSCNCC